MKRCYRITWTETSTRTALVRADSADVIAINIGDYDETWASIVDASDEVDFLTLWDTVTIDEVMGR